MIKGKEVPLSFVKSSFLYTLQLDESTPTAQRRWEAEGFDFGRNWGRIYSMPFRISTSTKLQSLQYRILHRYWPTRRYLCIRKVVDDPFCESCGEIETLEHCLFHCTEVQYFWNELVEVLNSKLPRYRHVVLALRDVIFGGLTNSSIVNMILLVAKQFVLQQRYHDGALSVVIFRQHLLKNFNFEKTNAFALSKLEKFKQRWRPFVTDSNTLLF